MELGGILHNAGFVTHTMPAFAESEMVACGHNLPGVECALLSGDGRRVLLS